ncbi:MAG TPA: sigma-70 family RNA polymerase sigma factor [Puia sp.]|nr:sigma-70 family RNA polymerase sigma factor [Puia sp.]
MEHVNLIPQLYRQEFSKMVALICSRFGIEQMDAAEDVVSETFLAAAETWGLKGIPDNPVGWLYRVARNNTLNGLKHERVFRKKVKGALVKEMASHVEPELDISPANIMDSQLRMLFAVSHPSLPVEAQVSLGLRILCGFTIDEIAQALLTTKANINKRLYRAKERLRSAGVRLELPDQAGLDVRLDAVLITLYLLFNEGYYSMSPDNVLRKELCLEAVRLTYLLAEYLEASNRGVVRADIYSLLALMCFQASRLDARVDAAGRLVLYEQQDSERWDTDLINRGNVYFVKACDSGVLSRYQLEAAIAWWHTHVRDGREKWENILMLYNKLLILDYSPVAALNRAYAYARVYGREAAIPEAEGLQLEGNLFYHSLLGELYMGVNDTRAVSHFERALELSTTDAERAVLMEKIGKCRRD